MARVSPRPRHRCRRQPRRAARDPRRPAGRCRRASDLGTRARGNRAHSGGRHHALGRADGRGRRRVRARAASPARVPDRDRRGAGLAAQRPPREHAHGNAAPGRLPLLSRVTSTSCAGCSSCGGANIATGSLSAISPTSQARSAAPRRRLCIFAGGCFGLYLTIEPTGEVSACDKYIDDDEYRFGHVLESGLTGVQLGGAARGRPPGERARGRADARLPLVRRLPWRLPARPLHERAEAPAV